MLSLHKVLAGWCFFKTEILTTKKKAHKETQADTNTLTVIKSQINKKTDCADTARLCLFQPKYKVSKHSVCIFPTAATVKKLFSAVSLNSFLSSQHYKIVLFFVFF